MKSLICAGLALVWTALSANAQQLSAEDLARRTIERRAVEAAIWGMPAVSMAGVRKSLAGIGADFNQVVYFSQPLEARHEFLTANNQTPYVMTVLDLRRGPVVVDVPPASSKVALFGSAIDSWQVPLVDLGPSGDDAGKGGKYLFLPPGYTGSRPDGHIVIASPTIFVHVALRPIILGQGTLADGVAYSQTLKVYPLAEAANPPTRYVDAYPKPWKTLPVYDLTFFRDLAAVVNDEPAQERDAVMLGLLASIGIEKASRSIQPARTPAHSNGPSRKPMRRCRTTSRRRGRRSFRTGRTASGRTHTVLRSRTSRSWSTANCWWTNAPAALDFLRRGCRRNWAPPAPIRYVARRRGQAALGPEQLSASSARRHARPRFLVGHRLQHEDEVDDPQPAKSGWPSSYDKSKLLMNADGSADLYFGPTAPAGKELNWLPTGEDFFLILRLYGPGKAYFDKTWKMNDIEQVN